MPELPEVETIARGLDRCLVGDVIDSVRVRWPGSVATPCGSEFERQLIGQTISAVWRRAKFLVIDLSRANHGRMSLIVHLRMTGRLLVDPAEPEPKHDHVAFSLSSGRTLTFRDVRKFGRIHLVSDKALVLSRLGPEPLAADFAAADLLAILKSRKRQIKPLLLDQQMIAGLGNIYVDESLWAACLHPLTRSHLVSDAQVESLYHGMRRVLQCALDNGGTTLRDYRDQANEPGRNASALQAYGKDGKPCSRCGTPIAKMCVGGRGTHYCPTCQPTPH